jgi:glycosyltransferase involved in cell wall biosynthesis
MTTVPNRICFINTTRFWGGGEKWHFETSTYLAERGHQVLAIVHPGGELHRRLAATPVDCLPMVITNYSFLNPLKFLKLCRTLRRKAIRVVVFNGSAEVKLGAPAARCARVQAIVYRRGLAVPVKNTFANRVLYGRWITHFLTNSCATTQILFQDLRVRDAASKTKTVYNGIDIQRFISAYGTASSGPKETSLTLGTAGRLEREKGHLHLLEMAARLKQRQLDFRLLIAGEGSQRPVLEKRIAQMGLTQCVHLLGFTADMPGFLRQLDIFVFPSLWEGFGYAAAEAMAAGLPVVAYDVASNREVVAPDVTGFLVPAEDIAALTEKTIMLAQAPELRKHMGLNGLNRVRECFDQEKQRQTLERYLCEEVLGGTHL